MTQEATTEINGYFRQHDSRPNTIIMEPQDSFSLREQGMRWTDLKEAVQDWLTNGLGFDSESYTVSMVEDREDNQELLEAVVEFHNDGITMAKLTNYLD
jgi:hypothetical protein